jgi:hypothetical protein
MQRDRSPSNRVDQAIAFGLWNVVPLLFNGCAKLLDIGGNWNTLSYTLIHSIPNMLNGWHVWWVCRPWKSWDIFSFQELCTDPCNMGLCIIMLKHEFEFILFLQGQCTLNQCFSKNAGFSQPANFQPQSLSRLLKQLQYRQSLCSEHTQSNIGQARHSIQTEQHRTSKI